MTLTPRSHKAIVGAVIACVWLSIAACGGDEKGTVVGNDPNDAATTSPGYVEGFPPGTIPPPGTQRISKEQAVERAKGSLGQIEGHGGTDVVDAIELPYGLLRARTGLDFGGDERVPADRSVWFVVLEGDFSIQPPGERPPIKVSKAYAVVDAYTGVVFELGAG